jgi:hypothetical protein
MTKDAQQQNDRPTTSDPAVRSTVSLAQVFHSDLIFGA